jgi:hypothetical protein
MGDKARDLLNEIRDKLKALDKACCASQGDKRIRRYVNAALDDLSSVEILLDDRKDERAA